MPRIQDLPLPIARTSNTRASPRPAYPLAARTGARLAAGSGSDFVCGFGGSASAPGFEGWLTSDSGNVRFSDVLPRTTSISQSGLVSSTGLVVGDAANRSGV